jgi:hypothetical protein
MAAIGAVSARGASEEFLQGLKSPCGKGQKLISTSLFDFRFCWSNATCAVLQKIQSVEIEVATQALKPVLPSPILSEPFIVQGKLKLRPPNEHLSDAF